MAEVVELDSDYGYKSKSREAAGEDDLLDVDSLPVAQIDNWLAPDGSRTQKWIKLPSMNAKVLIQAMTNNDFKQLRKEAPSVKTVSKGRVRVDKDEDWIQTQIIMRNLVEPKITDESVIENGLAGDVAHIVMEISKLSGFDVDKAIRDALE